MDDISGVILLRPTVSPIIYMGTWVRNQKDNAKLSEGKKARLMELGVTFDKIDPWEMRYALAKQFYGEYGHLKVPERYHAGGLDLNKWLSDQRQIYLGKRKGKTLSRVQIDRLDVIGMVWEDRNKLEDRAVWQKQYAEAKRFFEENGHLTIPRNYASQHGKNLSVWVINQRKVYLEGKLPDEKVELLRNRQNGLMKLELSGIPCGESSWKGFIIPVNMRNN